MTDLGDRIASTLRRERERRDLSVSELARRAGVAKATVSQLENGLAELELSGVGTSTSNRDRRASWHVDSPSVENPRGASSYFALGLPAGR